MNIKICERCDREMRLIPAGVSKKTNKPYMAFWTCDKRNGGCGETARAEGEAAQSAPIPAEAQPISQDRLISIEQKLDEILSLIKG
ncbi:MAG: hypothetical protein U9Q03_04845 [Patescibacteria group bacterium]|nr:hypothetical protein [Patescibacteria group bacterium]